MTTEERFWAKVAKSEGCWEWQGATIDGYGSFWENKRGIRAHRYSYRLHYGPFDERLVVRHSCDNPKCVRPEHLRLGTSSDNMRDRTERKPVESWNHEAAKTHCHNGHEFTDENTYVVPSSRARQCRKCKAVTDRNRRIRAREEKP